MLRLAAACLTLATTQFPLQAQSPSPSIDQSELIGIDYIRLPLALQKRIMPLTANLRPRQRFTAADVEQLSQSLESIEPTLRVLRIFSKTDSSRTGNGFRLVIKTAPASAPIRLSNVPAAKLLQKVEPIYPPLALQARIQGTVRFNIVITPEGTVGQLNLVSGHPLLIHAATDAVRRYRYQPTLINWEPVYVQAQVDIDFKL